MYTRNAASFVSALAVTLAVLLIIGGVVVFNNALDSGVAWAQLSPWTDSNGDLYPTDNENVVIGGTTEATADIFLDAEGNAVFNEQSSEVDFRVESDGNANMLFVDGADDYVGIGTSDPKARVHIYESGAGLIVPSNTYWMMQNNGASANSSYLGMLAGDTGETGLWLGDGNVPEAGQIAYDNNTDDLTVTATDDIVLDGDVVYLDGGFRANRVEKDDVDYQVLGTDYYIAYTDVDTANLYVDMPSTAAGDAGRVFLIGLEGHTSGTLNIRNYSDAAVSGNNTLTAAGDLRHVICTGADTWYAY